MTLSDLQRDIKTGKRGSSQATFIDSLYESLKKHYIKQQRDWYINERFIRGEHWIVFNKTTNSVQTIPISSGEVRRTINKIRTQLRGIKNFIKRNQPRWQTEPEGSTDEALQEAIDYNKILQNVYETRKIPTLLTDVIINSLKTSVGILEGGLVKKGGSTYLDFWVNDTFDVFFDPSASCINDCRFILKAVKKPISYLKESKIYKVDGELTADNREGGSDYKDVLEKQKYNKENSLKDLETIIVKELWYKYENKEGDTIIKKITSAGNQIILVEETPYKRFPFFIFNPEKSNNAIYTDPWLKDLISPNKSLDKVVSQIETYIQRMLAGKYIIKRGVEVSSITDKGAEKVTYKGNQPPVFQQLPPLPSTPFQYMANLEKWIEEFGGIREASLGRVPGSLQSGRGIEALQSADAATVSEPIENLENMLSEVGEFILEIISENQISSDTIYHEKGKVKYIGSEAGIEPEGTIIVKPRRVKVRIVPEIAYTEDARREMVFKLAEAGIIDPETLMEYLNISNISDIIERVKVKKAEEFKEEMVKQKESHRSAGEMPDDSASLADQENMQMAAGQQVPLTPRALWVPEHLELHMAFINENRDAYEQNMEMFDEHIRNEENYLREVSSPQGSPEGQPLEGQSPQEAIIPQQPPQGPPMPEQPPGGIPM